MSVCCAVLQGFTQASVEGGSSYPPALILLLSKLVHDMERSTISYLVSCIVCSLSTIALLL